MARIVKGRQLVTMEAVLAVGEGVQEETVGSHHLQSSHG